jgi:dTDP-4-dehydrorhamnose reductase
MSRTVLIVGGDSVIGAALARRLGDSGAGVVTTTRRDVAESDTVRRLDLRQAPPSWNLPACDVAVLCASVGNLETCRQQPDATRLVNVTHTALLAQRLADQGTFVVLLSTNLVFDGSQPRVPVDAAVSPQTEYGRQKAEAERPMLGLGGGGAVVRLTKVFHPKLALVNRWIEALKRGEAIDAFSNYVCSPVALDTVVQGLQRLVEESAAGLWQFSGPDQVAYADIAQHLAVRLDVSSDLVRSTSAAGKLEHVPRFATLDASRATAELGLEFKPALPTIDEVYFRDAR